jgi:hypothetical protein
LVRNVLRGSTLWLGWSPAVLHCRQISPLCLQFGVRQTRFSDSLPCSFFLSQRGYLSFYAAEIIEVWRLSLMI